MKKILSIGLALLCLSIVALGADTVVTSPNGQIKVTVNTADGLSWTVSRNGKTVYTENGIALIIGGKTLGDKAKVKSIKQKPGNQIIHPIVPLKFSEIRDNYYQLRRLPSAATCNGQRCGSPFCAKPEGQCRNHGRAIQLVPCQ